MLDGSRVSALVEAGESRGPGSGALWRSQPSARPKSSWCTPGSCPPSTTTSSLLGSTGTSGLNARAGRSRAVSKVSGTPIPRCLSRSVSCGQPARVLQQATDGADLLLLARRHGGFPFCHLVGTGRALLRGGHCPVEMVPPANEPSDIADRVRSASEPCTGDRRDPPSSTGVPRRSRIGRRTNAEHRTAQGDALRQPR